MAGANVQTEPLHVWVLSDDQPGHYSLSNGIVAALRRIKPVEVRELSVGMRFGLARNLMRELLNREGRLPGPDWMKLFYRMPSLPAGGCDLIVSAGGKTSFANAWLAKQLGVPNVFVGSLRRLSPGLFTLVVTMEPLEPPVDNNLVLDLPPSALDREQAERQAGLLRQSLGVSDERFYTLLIGGDGAGYSYHETDWQRLANLVNRLGEADGIRWLVAGSRRTGSAATGVLQSRLNPEVIAGLAWYREGDALDVAARLGAAERVFVTEDSMTMLTEAISTERPVVSLQPERIASTARYEAMIKKFAGHGWLSRWRLADNLTGLSGLLQGRSQSLDESPLEALSRLLQQRLG